MSPFSPLQDMFLNSILSDVNEIAFMCSNVFRVVENVECFCNFFYEWAVGFVLYIILMCVGAKGSASA